MPVVSPSAAFVGAQRYGAIFMQAQFLVYKLGYAYAGPFTNALSTGSLTVDRNSTYRRTGQFTIEVDPTIPPSLLVPANPSALLAPFGTEITVQVGIASSSPGSNFAQVTQWVPLGFMGIATSDVDDTVENTVVTVNTYDRSYMIDRRKFKQPYNFPAASGNFVDEIVTLLNQVWGETAGIAPLQYNITPTDATVPTASYNQGSSPWQAATDMAAAIGYELFFDINGIVTGRPIPNPYTTAPCWSFIEDQTVITSNPASGGSETLLGSPYSTPPEVQVQMTSEGIYNDIIIQGTGSANTPAYTGPNGTAVGAPILGEAMDNNPSSPTYVLGGLGDIPNFVSSSLINSSNAQEMANNQLQASLSQAWTVTMQIAPNPIFDIDDVVAITRARVGLNNAYVVIDTITHNIRYGDLTTITGRVLSNNNP